MVVCLEEREGAKNPATCCVDVGTLRLYRASNGMVQIENEILG